MRTALLLALALAATAGAAEMPDWKYEQPVRVPQPGLHTINLAPATLDSARPGLEDLRLLDPNDRETPYLVTRPMPVPPSSRPARKFDAALVGETTVLTIETGVEQPIQAVTLSTRAGNFIKAVTVEGSTDGREWRTIVMGRPIFQQPGGASQLTIGLPAGVRPFLRLTIDDRRAEPVPFAGATVHPLTGSAAPAEPAIATITEHSEGNGQSRFVIDLGAAHLTVAALRFECAAPLFMRQARIAVREATANGITERVLAAGTIYRVAIENQPAADHLYLSVERQMPYRELVVIVENEDNPPLNITGIHATRRPCLLSFHATQPGEWQLFSGNPFAAAPRYDLAALGAQLKMAGIGQLTTGPLAGNPSYRPREVLPEIADMGSVLDVSGWEFRQPVRIARDGVQQLELSLETLAHAGPMLSDLRLIRDGKQRPYVLERTDRQQKVMVTATPANDEKQPSVSRWRIKLPQAGLPVTKLVCVATTTLFQREMQVGEMTADRRGEPFVRQLGSAVWTRTPGSTKSQFEIAIASTPQTDTLFLTTDNRDNTPITLETFAIQCPVVRLWFKSPSEPATFLYFGNPRVGPPQYDIALVAPQLLAAERSTATLGHAEQLSPTVWADRPGNARSRSIIFWSALAVVVVVLLALLVKFLPKETPAK